MPHLLLLSFPHAHPLLTSTLIRLRLKPSIHETRHQSARLNTQGCARRHIPGLRVSFALLTDSKLTLHYFRSNSVDSVSLRLPRDHVVRVQRSSGVKDLLEFYFPQLPLGVK